MSFMTPEELIDKINKSKCKIYGYVYIITNKSNNKIYIGQSKKLDNKNIVEYYGSGVKIRKVNKKLLQKEIIRTADDLYELSDWETFYIQFYKSYKNNIGYNISEYSNYFNERNMSGQNNPASKTNMSKECLKKKADKAIITKKNNIDEYNGLSILSSAATKAAETKRNVIIDGKRYDQKIASKIHQTQRENGTDIIRIARGVETKRKNNIFQEAARKAAITTKERGSLKGKNNPRAKKYILIAPWGEIIFAHGTLDDIVNVYNLNRRLLIRFLNCGKIMLTSRMSCITSKNTVGWEIKENE